VKEKPDLDKLTPAERRALLAALLQKKAATSLPMLSALALAAARRAPDAVAVIDAAGRALRYAELAREAGRITGAVLASGIEPGAPIGLLAPCGARAVAGLVGILAAGVACAPLDPQDDAARLSRAIEQHGVRVVVTDDARRARLPEGIVVVRIDDEATHDGSARTGRVEPGGLAHVDSGGARRTHADLAGDLAWLQASLGFGPGDVVLHAAALDLDVALWEIFGALAAGARLAVSAEDASAGALLRQIASQRVSVAFLDPARLAALVTALDTSAALDLGSLRHVVVSGGILRQSLVDALLRRLPVEVRFVHALAEAGGILASHRCAAGEPVELVPAGLPARRPLLVLDAHGRLAAPGARGEIFVGGPDLPRSTALVDNPFPEIAGAHLLATGDLARRGGDGVLHLAGSLRREIWRGGRRVALPAIESALLRDPGVVECAVLAREGAGVAEPVAYVVVSTAFDAARLEAHLARELPRGFRPAAFVPVARIQLTASGEVDARALEDVEVLDDDLLRRWERALAALPGVERVAVLVEPSEVAVPRVHVGDLVPRQRPVPTPLADRRDGSAEVRAAQAGGLPAVSAGPALPADPAAPELLADVLTRAAARSTQGILYVGGEEPDRFQPYAALLEEAERILAGLRRLGLAPRDPVILLLPRHTDFVPVLWACFLGGFVPVPLAAPRAMDRVSPELSKLGNALRLLGAPLIVAGGADMVGLRGAASLLEVPALRAEAVEALREAPRDVTHHRGSPDDLALLLLTSGSTGKPKAVMQTHRALLSRTRAVVLHNGHTAEEITFNWMPLEHVGGLVMYHLRDVVLGCRQIHAPTEVILADPLRWLEIVDRHRVTDTWAPNFAFGLVNARAAEIAERSFDLRSLRFILNGGEAIVPRTARAFLRLLAPFGLSGAAMRPAWGMSETCSGVVYSDAFSIDRTSDDDAFTDLGTPVPGVVLRIVDERGEVVRGDAIGRLEIKGPSITAGHYGSPELDEETFTEGGFMRVGDLGFLRDGRLTITGRAKDEIIVNGANFPCHELESAVEEVPGVVVSFTAACAVREARTDTDRVAIFLVATPTEPSAVRELIQAARAAVLRRVGINPDFVIPVEREAIPKTSIGKIQRGDLARRFQAGDFDDAVKRVDLICENDRTMPDWFFRKVWRRKERRAATPGGPGRTLVFLDRGGVGAALCDRIERRGGACIRVEAGAGFEALGPDRFRIAPASAGDLARLVDAVGPIDAVAHLFACDAGADVARAIELGAVSALLLIQALARAQADRPLCLRVATHRSALAREDDLGGPAHGALVGLLRTVPLEIEPIDARLVDLEGRDPDVDAASLLREVDWPRGDAEVAYRDGERLVAALAPAELAKIAPGPLPLVRGGLYLVTGGLGGIGSALARRLSRDLGARLLLVGRTALPPRETWIERRADGSPLGRKVEALLALEDASAEVTYEALDVTDAAALAAAITRAEERFARPLDGAFHLAAEGSLADHWAVAAEHRLATISREVFRARLRAKVEGTLALYEALARRPDALVVTFSSVNGTFGGGTFGAYSAASSFLESSTLARRRSTHPRSACFVWSMWDDVGMSRDNPRSAIEAARAMGYAVLGVEQGLDALFAGLCRGEPHLVVGLDAARPRIRRELTAGPLTTQRLSAYLTSAAELSPARLAEISAVDRAGARTACEVCRVTDLPLDERGEIDRARLVEAAKGPRAAASGHVLPRDEAERALGAIFQEALGVRGEIGVRDNFFDLGATSLTLVKVHGRIKGRFGVDLPIVELFNHTTIEKLAARLGERTPREGDDAAREAVDVARARRELGARRRRQRGGNE
jgi:acyl-CoA synthetase (AMP-forming)/AMP-acid ligase II/acyl carrier protein